MVAEFEVMPVAGQKLVRVRLSDPRCGVANFHGLRWPSTIFHEVVSEREALAMCMHLWDATEPCWRRLALVVD
jgi:hypothetical protein